MVAKVRVEVVDDGSGHAMVYVIEGSGAMSVFACLSPRVFGALSKIHALWAYCLFVRVWVFAAVNVALSVAVIAAVSVLASACVGYSVGSSQEPEKVVVTQFATTSSVSAWSDDLKTNWLLSGRSGSVEEQTTLFVWARHTRANEAICKAAIWSRDSSGADGSMTHILAARELLRSFPIETIIAEAEAESHRFGRDPAEIIEHIKGVFDQ